MRNFDKKRLGKMCPVVTLDTTFPEIDPAVSLVTSSQDERNNGLQPLPQNDGGGSNRQTARDTEMLSVRMRDRKQSAEIQPTGGAESGLDAKTADVELDVVGGACLTRRSKYTRRSRHHDPTDQPAVVRHDSKQAARITRLQSVIDARCSKRLPPSNTNSSLVGSMSTTTEVPVPNARKLKVRHTKKTAQIKANMHKPKNERLESMNFAQRYKQASCHLQSQASVQVAGESPTLDHWLDGMGQSGTTGKDDTTLFPNARDDREYRGFMWQSARDAERLAPHISELDLSTDKQKIEYTENGMDKTLMDVDLDVIGGACLTRRSKYTRRSRHHDPTDQPAVVRHDSKHTARITRLQNERSALARRGAQRLSPISGNASVVGPMSTTAEAQITSARKLNVRHTKKTAQIKANIHSPKSDCQELLDSEPHYNQTTSNIQFEDSIQCVDQSPTPDQWLNTKGLMCTGNDITAVSSAAQDERDSAATWKTARDIERLPLYMLDQEQSRDEVIAHDDARLSLQLRVQKQTANGQTTGYVEDTLDNNTENLNLGVMGGACLTRRFKYTRQSRHHDPTDQPAVVRHGSKHAARITRQQIDIAARTAQRLPPVTANASLVGSMSTTAEVAVTSARKLKVRHTKKTAQIKANMHKPRSDHRDLIDTGEHGNQTICHLQSLDSGRSNDHSAALNHWIDEGGHKGTGNGPAALTLIKQNNPAVCLSNKMDKSSGCRKLKVRHTKKTAQIKSNRHTTKRNQDRDTGPLSNALLPVNLDISYNDKDALSDHLRTDQDSIGKRGTCPNIGHIQTESQSVCTGKMTDDLSKGQSQRQSRSLCISNNTRHANRSQTTKEPHTLRLIIHYDDPKSPTETLSPAAPATPSPALTPSNGVADDGCLRVVEKWDCFTDLDYNSDTYAKSGRNVNPTCMTTSIATPLSEAMPGEFENVSSPLGSTPEKHTRNDSGSNYAGVAVDQQGCYSPTANKSRVSRSSVQNASVYNHNRLLTKRLSSPPYPDKAVTSEHGDQFSPAKVRGLSPNPYQVSMDRSTGRERSFKSQANEGSNSVSSVESLSPQYSQTESRHNTRSASTKISLNRLTKPFKYNANHNPDLTSVSSRTKEGYNSNASTTTQSSITRNASRASTTSAKSVQTERASLCSTNKSIREISSTPRSVTSERCRTVTPGTPRFRQPSAVTIQSACSTVRSSNGRSSAVSDCRSSTARGLNRPLYNGSVKKSTCSTACSLSGKASAAKEVKSACNTSYYSSGKSSSGSVIKSACNTAHAASGKSSVESEIKCGYSTARGSNRKSSCRSVCSTVRGSSGKSSRGSDVTSPRWRY